MPLGAKLDEYVEPGRRSITPSGIVDSSRLDAAIAVHVVFATMYRRVTNSRLLQTRSARRGVTATS